MHKILSVLNKKQKKFFYLFFFLSFFSLGFEILGLGLIIPFLEVMINSSRTDTYLSFINNFIEHDFKKNDLIIFFTISFFVIYSIKVIFISAYNYFLIKFFYDLKTNLSNKLFQIYLSKPYIFFKQNNSANLIRNLDDSRYIMILFRSILTIFVETTFFVGLILFLIYLEPQITSISLIFFGTLSFLFYKFIQNKAGFWGDQRASYDGKKIKSIMHGVGGIKEIKILGKENFFFNNYSENNFFSNYYSLKQDFVLNIPRHLLEWLTIIFLLSFVLININVDKQISKLIPLIGLYSVAIYRILPSINKIVSSLQTVKFCLPTIKPFINEFEDLRIINLNGQKKSESSTFDFQDSIEIKQLEFNYENSDKVLVDINFKIKKGDFIGIAGKSGTGKTTLMNLILGLYKPINGEILVDKKNINNNLFQWQNKIGYVPQNIYFADTSIKKNIAFGCEEKKIDEAKIIQCLKITNLYDYVFQLEKNIDTNLGELGDRFSGGQKQRIGIARALYHNPEILILDEFTNSLDKENEIKIANEVKNFKDKKTTIIISHSKEVLNLCDNILHLN